MSTIGFWEGIKRKQTFNILTLSLFAVIAIWYFYLHQILLSNTLILRQIWGSCYQAMAVLGVIAGLFAARSWGYKSLLGKSALFFSIGMLLQVFGQSVDSYYNFFLNATIPYPSLGDVGFFGSVIAYIVAAVFLLKATGINVSVKSIRGKMVAFLVPAIILIVCYYFFLQGYQFDWSNKLKIALDFGYPLGQATYVSIAILSFIMTQRYFGGYLRLPVVFLIIALVFQYLSDFTFLYQANAGTWYVGGLNDFMYFFSYTLMALALIYFGGIHQAISESPQ